MARLTVGVVATLVALAPTGVSPQVVTMDTHVQARLDSLAETPTEHVVCIYGVVDPDTVFLLSLRQQAESLSAAQTVVAVEPCNTALAVWHNHPVPADSTPAGYLYFTKTDQATFLRYEQALLAFVGVRTRRWCMWTRRQVTEAWTRNLTPLWPIAGQCWAPPPAGAEVK